MTNILCRQTFYMEFYLSFPWFFFMANAYLFNIKKQELTFVKLFPLRRAAKNLTPQIGLFVGFFFYAALHRLIQIAL